MEKDTVLVISNKFDNHADGIVSGLDDYKIPTIRLNTEDFRKNDIFFTHKDNYFFQIITSEDRIISPEKIKSVYVRRITKIDVSDIEDDYQKFSRDEAYVVLNSLPTLFSDSRWMDLPAIREIANNKITQLITATKSGLKIPETVISNNSENINAFCRPNRTIYKTLSNPIITFNEKMNGMVSTTLLNDNLISSITNSASVTPCLVQDYTNKAFELRVHIIGKKIIAVKIDSQNHDDAHIDWRLAEFNELDYSEYDLPNHIRSSLLKFMSLLNLNFGIIDMIVTPNNEYVFLELNPNGNWWWIENKTKLPISRSIIEWLVG